MNHEIVIRNGLIVDGTGAEPFVGDIAVDGDTIAAVGEVSGDGKEEIAADGLAVTPGFIDLHTHLDAQIGGIPCSRPFPGTGSRLLSSATAGSRSRPANRKTGNFWPK